MHEHSSRRQAAWSVLALCMVATVVAAQQVNARELVQPTTGVSSLTSIARWPIDPDMRLIQHQRFLFASRALPARRVLMESALREVLTVAVPTAIGAARTTNFTYIPATTPGYEGYNTIVYEVDVYLLKTIDPQSVALSPGHVFLTAQLLRSTLRANFSSDIQLLLTERHYTTMAAEKAAQPVVAASNTSQLYASTLSRIQLSGEGLLPFSADKQTAFGLAVFYAFSNRTSLYTLNVTDLAAPPNAVRSRKLLQSAVPTVTVEVWTQSLAANYSASRYWDKVFSSDALHSVGPLRLNLTGRFINATTELRTYNETILGYTFDPPHVDTASSDDAALSPGAIAGIAIGCAVAAALLVAACIALLFKHRQRLHVRRLNAQAAAAAASHSGTESSENDSFEHFKPGKGADASFESAAKIWGSSDSFDGSAPGHVTELFALPEPGPHRAPTLDAANIEICVDACGKPLVLARAPGCRVYRGRHQQRDVAIKELSVQDRPAAAIHTEVQLAERLSRDANVVQFYGTAVTPHAVLLVMEFLPGGDLRAALDGPCGSRHMWHCRGACIAADVARGLAYIHSASVVHRDLKSSNVLLAADGTRAKLADFGSAMLVGAMEPADDKPRGTLAWASPELLAGTAVDAKADVWSLGVVLWEIATGEVPVRGMMRALKVPADCPAAVAQLVAACMAEQPSERPGAAEVAEQLQALAA